MKSPHHADLRSAPTNYAPSVPMSVYRELAAELRASKAVIDSLNSRNQQILQQNQFLKQEIHNVVQSALTLGQAAGIARQAPQMGSGMPGMQDGFPNALAQPLIPERIAPDTLARLAQSEANATPVERAYERPTDYAQAQNLDYPNPPVQLPTPAESARPQPLNPAEAQNRVPRPITPATQKASQSANQKAPQKTPQKAIQRVAKPKTEAVTRKMTLAVRQQPSQTTGRRTKSIAVKQFPSQNKPKLFTEQSGEYRSSVLDTKENKEIGGIWLVLSIILIIVTAFGAGFLIMKPLLNNR